MNRIEAELERTALVQALLEKIALWGDGENVRRLAFGG